MSAAVATFDTLKFVRRLRDAGVEEKQAEAFSEAIKEVQDAQLQELATKGDILATKGGLRELKLEIMAEIAPLKWGMAVCVAGIITLILKSFFPH
ncbi:MAG: DUF1640 domain-containing protein [Magnetococcales bacterium]|nr:DUF1640 domain-containing protein [Magnetococcales bacterium]